VKTPIAAVNSTHLVGLIVKELLPASAKRGSNSTPFKKKVLFFQGEDIAELAQLASQIFPIGHVYYFKKTAEEDQFEAMVKQVKENLGANDQILLKGSNSMNLAKLVERLQED